MFVAWLRERDPDAFAKVSQSVENGDSIRDSFNASFAAEPPQRWRNFVSGLSK
jgi:predicted Co/Zn/Cd cation transporter (cation efflux family)